MRLIDADKLEPDADYEDGEYCAYSITQIRNASIETTKWEKDNDIYYCSKCNGLIPALWYSYCPYCGRKVK